MQEHVNELLEKIDDLTEIFETKQDILNNFLFDKAIQNFAYRLKNVTDEQYKEAITLMLSSFSSIKSPLTFLEGNQYVLDYFTREKIALVMMKGLSDNKKNILINVITGIKPPSQKSPKY